jgi:membrane protease YdiL (CAAX protease family)
MKSPSLATALALVIGFLGPLLLASPASRVLGDPERVRTQLLCQLVMWAFLAVVLWVVLVAEQRPLASIGLRPPGWRSLAWGVALAALIMWVLTPLNLWLLRRTGLAGFEGGIGKFGELPLALQLFAVLTAGVVEEVLYRGFPLERIAEWTGSAALAGAAVVAVFALVHLPMWGPGPVLTFLVSGAVVTAWYVWQRDLTATIVAHVIVDAMGLVVVPYFSRAPGSAALH